MTQLARVRCWRCQRLLVRGFASGHLDGRAARFVWDELRACAGCRTVHQRLVEGARLLQSNGESIEVPSTVEFELFKHRVVAAPSTTASARGWIWVPALAAAVLFIGVPRLLLSTESEFVARGTAEPQASVRFFCQSRSGGRVRPLSGDSGECAKDDVIALGYQSDGPTNLAVHAGGAWLSKPGLSKTQVLTLVEGELSLAGEATTITAVFSSQPLEATKLEALRAQAAPVPPGVTVRVFTVTVKNP